MRHRPPSPALPGLRAAPLLLALCAALLAVPARSQETASATTPAPTASAGYSTRDFEGFDADRQRCVPVRLYLPLAASAQRPVPLVVFSHGIGGSRRATATWAAIGPPWHRQPASAARGQRPLAVAGQLLLLVSRFQHAASDEEAIARVQDFSFALDRLLAGTQGVRT